MIRPLMRRPFRVALMAIDWFVFRVGWTTPAVLAGLRRGRGAFAPYCSNIDAKAVGGVDRCSLSASRLRRHRASSGPVGRGFARLPRSWSEPFDVATFRRKYQANDTISDESTYRCVLISQSRHTVGARRATPAAAP